ncbi:MAG TPA: hypothetical protein VHV83_15290, partial [Armatimonadota bacterium]|nr:hypothetical protein [Armatimonadota bacterium]
GDQEAKQKFDSTSYAYMQTFYHADDDITAVAVTMSTPMLLAYRTCGRTTQMRCQSEVRHPSEKIMVYEWATNHDAPLRSMWDPTGAHNALFADGHVAVVKEETIKQSALGDHDPNWTIDGLAGKDVE